MCPRPHLSLCACKTSWLAPEFQVSVGPRPHLSLCACKTAWLAQESLVSMGLSPHLWFLHAKQRDFHQNDKSIWVPAHMCGFWMQNNDFRTRITSLCRWIDPTCGFCMQNSDFWTIITSLCRSHTSPVIFCMQNSMPSIRNTSLHGSQPSRVVFGCKTATYGPEKQVSLCPNPHLCFF